MARGSATNSDATAVPQTGHKGGRGTTSRRNLLAFAIVGVAATFFQLLAEQWLTLHVLEVPEQNLALIPILQNGIPKTQQWFGSTTEPKRTTIVVIHDPSPCGIRSTIGRIAKASVENGAAAVAIDLVLDQANERSCAAESQSMEEQIRQACVYSPRGIPLIAGVRLDRRTGAPVPSVSLAPEGTLSKCMEGVINTDNVDARVIPLGFTNDGVWDSSISWISATQVDANLSGKLARYRSGVLQLHTKPLEGMDFTSNFTLRDADFLAADAKPDLWPKIRGHVILIGSDLDPARQIPGSSHPLRGYELHARYIEALLTDGYLLIPPKGIDLIFVLITAWALRLIDRTKMWHGGLFLLGGTVLVLALDAFSIGLLGYYLTFTSVSLFTVWVWFFAKLKEFQWSKKFFPAEQDLPKNLGWISWLC